MIKTENIREFKQLCDDLHIGNDWSKIQDAKIIWEAAIEWISKKEKIAAEFIDEKLKERQSWRDSVEESGEVVFVVG